MYECGFKTAHARVGVSYGEARRGEREEQDLYMRAQGSKYPSIAPSFFCRLLPFITALCALRAGRGIIIVNLASLIYMCQTTLFVSMVFCV